MTSTYTVNKHLEEPANGDYPGNWNTPVNANFSAIDQALGGTTSLNVTGLSGTVTLTTVQYQSLYLAVSGTLTANVTFQFPSGVGGMWVVTNATTGAFTLSFTGGGSTVTISQGVTNTIFNSQPGGLTFLTTPPAVPGGSSTQVQFNNSGTLAGSSSLTWDGTAFFTGTGSNPGYFGGAGTRIAASGGIGTAISGAHDALYIQKDNSSGTFIAFFYGGLSATPTSALGSINTDGSTLYFQGTATNATYATNAGSAAASLVATTATNVTNLTSAQVGAAYAGISAGSVGTYAMAAYAGSGIVSFGSTVAGNYLAPCDATGTTVGTAFSSATTWRCLGRVDTVSYGTPYAVTLWERVS
jgi:hypothetical protein